MFCDALFSICFFFQEMYVSFMFKIVKLPFIFQRCILNVAALHLLTTTFCSALDRIPHKCEIFLG